MKTKKNMSKMEMKIEFLKHEEIDSGYKKEELFFAYFEEKKGYAKAYMRRKGATKWISTGFKSRKAIKGYLSDKQVRQLARTKKSSIVFLLIPKNKKK